MPYMDKVYIKNIIQKILDKEFKSSEKRRINDFIDRINFSCFYCGDSDKNIHKKRGNLYFNKLVFICFNCGKKTGFDRVAKDFNQQIDPDKKLEIIEHLSNNINYDDFNSEAEDAQLSNLLKLSDINRIFNSGQCVITQFKPIEKNELVYNYLVSRGISENLHKNIYQAKYWVNDEFSQDVIVLLNRRDDKVLGIQIRNLKEGKKRMFKIYNFEALYKWVNNVEVVEDIDISQLVTLNTISYYFNILNVDFNYPVTIFEGYIDSLFFPNSIGVVGTNTNMKFLENKNLEIRYMFDNDEAGFKKSDEKIKNGYPIFLWKKLFEDIVSKKKNEDPFKLMERIEKVKDLNKLAELINNPYKKLNLDSFFSNDIFDIKWIPFYKKKSFRKKNI
jgi:hypothetical protein